MTRLGKFMVYNPKKDKPVKYYANFEDAKRDAEIIRNKSGQDVLVLHIVHIAQKEKGHKYSVNVTGTFIKNYQVAGGDELEARCAAISEFENTYKNFSKIEAEIVNI